MQVQERNARFTENLAHLPS